MALTSKIGYTVIMPTSINYLDITQNFIDLLKINWPEALDRLVISTVGRMPDTFDRRGKKVIENSDNAKLPECVLNAVRNEKSDYYIIFLGDSFIEERIDDREIHSLLTELRDNNIQYCRLFPKSCIGEKKVFSKFRLLRMDERYGHTFTAFIATRNFVEKKFNNKLTDRDFELEYLRLARSSSKKFYHYDAVLTKNLFHIATSLMLIKGKWNRRVFKRLKKKYPNVKFADRELISYRKAILLSFQRIFWHLLPDKVRLSAKKIFRNYFDTNL